MNSFAGKEEVLVDMLVRTYEQIVLIEVESGMGQWICGKNQTDISDYAQWCADNTAKDYFGDDLNIFLQKIQLDAVCEALKYEDDYILEYSKKEDGIVCRKRMKMFLCRKDTVLCICVDDVTHEVIEKRRERELVASSLDLAHRSNAVKEQFLYNMKQEMREPLQGVKGMLEEALSSEGDARTAYIEKAEKCVEQYIEQVEQLFVMSDIEKGELYVRDEVVMADRLLEQLQVLLAERASAKNIILKMNNKNPKMNTFYLDRIHITRMLWNLMSVMIKGSCEGSALDMELGFDVDEENELFDLTISVKGDGEVDLTDESPIGAGMDLVYRMVDCFSGVIRVSGENENRVAVDIRIPVQPVDKKDQSEAGIIAHLVDHIKERDFSKYRALVVDDNEINRDITVALLRKFGLQVETAESGQEAIDMLLASPGRYYQIMFMNPVLPGKTGFETTMEIREMKRRDINDITVVALTSNGLRDERIRSLEHGMDYHIVLPLDEVELKEILIRELQDLSPRDEHEVFGFRVLK
nr:response regulator [Lachnospiraceae bacterium]